MITTIVIGKNSNLSNKLSSILENCILISSRDILEDVDILLKFKKSSINIIFNNFQTSTQLNNILDTKGYIENSILCTSLVLEYFKDTQINKIIYTSSSSVYGNNILCKESDEVKPMNLHASLKVANEKLVEKYCTTYNIDYTIARVFNMYGGDDKFSIISKIIDSYIKHTTLTIVNNGNAIRDFIHIDDVVELYKNILSLKKVNILNIGTGNGSSIKNVLDFLQNHGAKIDIENIQRDELKISTADTGRLLQHVDKKDFKNIEDYLKEKLVL